MSLADRRRLRGMLGLLAWFAMAPGAGSEAAGLPSPGQGYGIDPASVRRQGPAYRYPRAGWTVLHIEGEPYDRGYQHGRLMASEIADYLKALACARNPSSPSEGWKGTRTLVDALFLRRYDKEYLEEMKGIADGATSGGATFDGRAVDLIDVAAINSDIEVGSLDDALGASARGLEGRAFRDPGAGKPKAEHCSAFAAIGPATVDGKIVIGHITMWSLATSRFFNVWLDVMPSQGHRVLMQSYPGGIQSGMDYYQNDAGLVVVETTIGQTTFDPDGLPLASRIRKALQYGDSIDSVVSVLSKKNNGLYSNEWLLADTRANEIAMFELGTRKSKLWRSGKKEWFGGTEGFYWGCNNAKDVDVRLETLASVEARPANLVWRATDRDRSWVALYDESKGKIDAGFGFKAFTTPPLASASSLDAKFTTTGLAGNLKSWALFGPPTGRTWEPSEWERAVPGIRPLVANDWTTLTAEPPAPAVEASKAAVDLAGVVPLPDSWGDETRAPAWHGTILPQADADAWLAAAFADYERVVARGEGPGRDLALYGARTRYLAAARRLGRDVPLSKTRADLASSDWYEIASGKGVLLLDALREAMGHVEFAAMMDEFGRSHAGHAVETAHFRAHAEKVAGASKPLGSFFARWLDEPGLPDAPEGGTWAVDSFQAEPEKALIVYGTLRDVHANAEAARKLQRGFAARWSNVLIPVKADTEATEEDWKSHHVLLVGRPATLADDRGVKALPVTFGPASFALKGETYAHPGSAVIAAADNPLNPRFEVVLFAGLGAESTWHCVEHLEGRHAEVVLLAEGAPPRALVVGTPIKKDEATAKVED